MMNPSPIKKAWLSLGSNMGESRENLTEAIRLIGEKDGVSVTKVSSFYATKPWGYTDQADFVNLVAEVETTLLPEKLLEHCLEVEQELGRIRVIHWGPRVVDVDVVLFESFESSTETLTVPHMRMWERAFVMVPLLEIAVGNVALKAELQRHGRSMEELEIAAENLQIEQGAIKDK